MKTLTSHYISSGLITIVGLVFSLPVHSQESEYLTRAEVEQLLVGKNLEINNAQRGKILWNINSNGYIFGNVLSNGFVGKGTWNIREDGGFCVKWQTPTPDYCHYYFRDGEKYKAVTRKPEESAPDASMKAYGKEVLPK